MRCKATLRLVPTADKTITYFANQRSHTIFTFHLKNLLIFRPCNRCNDSYKKIYLAEIKVDTGEFEMMLFLFLKLPKKSSQNMKGEQKFWIRKILKIVSLYVFWHFSNWQGYFLNFLASDSSWINKSRDFLIFFSWLFLSESILIYILLNL